MDNPQFRFQKKDISTSVVSCLAHARQREESEVLDWRRRADLTRSEPAPLRREVKLFMIDRPRQLTRDLDRRFKGGIGFRALA